MTRITLLFLIGLCFPLVMVGQGIYARDGNYNRAGLEARYGFFALNTDDFNLEGKSAFFGGLTTRGRLYNEFGLVYGLDFLHATLNIQGRPLGELVQEDIGYTVIGAQVHVLASYNIIKDQLAIDFGPALLVNGRMSLDNNGQRDNIIEGYNSLTAEDIQQVSKVNLFGVLGVTGGVEHIRFMLQYQVGVGNFLGNLDNQNLRDIDSDARGFRGTASMITGGIVFLF